MAKSIGFGAALLHSTNGVSYALLGQVHELSGPDASRAEVDCTTLDSTAKEYLVSVRDGGSVTVGITWDTTNAGSPIHHRFTGLLAGGYDVTNPANASFWRIEHPSDTDVQIIWRGYVTAFSPSFPMEDKISAQVTIKVDQKVTWPT